jgi:signal transduction histidine kinase
MKARAYLAVMALAVLVPIILFSAIALSMLMQAERETALRSLQETARATTLAVDRELSIAEARMKVMASATSLIEGDFKAFHERAVLANKGSKSWTVLFDENGQQLLNTLVPYGTKLPRRGHPEYGHEVLRTGVMRVSDLLKGAVANGPVLAIDVPVILEDKRRYVLSQAFLPDALDVAVRRSEAPANYIIGIFDRKGISIARSQRAAELVGKPVRKELFEGSRNANEGVLQHDTRENIRVYDAYKRSALSGWTVAVGVPVVVIEASARRAIMVASLGLMAAIACALALAVFFSRRMAQSIDSAASSAAALGHGETPQPYSSGVLEFDRLHAALESAGGILQQERESRASAEQERARLFASEQEARLLAENQNRAKDEFLAMLSHELRNPLAAISNSIALMEHPARSGRRRARLRAGHAHYRAAGTASFAGEGDVGLGGSRSDPYRANHFQPGRQCAEIYAGRRRHYGRCGQQRRKRGPYRQRHRHRHAARTGVARVRRLRAGHRCAGPFARWPGHRPGAGPPTGSTAWR